MLLKNSVCLRMLVSDSVQDEYSVPDSRCVHLVKTCLQRVLNVKLRGMFASIAHHLPVTQDPTNIYARPGNLLRQLACSRPHVSQLSMQPSVAPSTLASDGPCKKHSHLRQGLSSCSFELTAVELLIVAAVARTCMCGKDSGLVFALA